MAGLMPGRTRDAKYARTPWSERRLYRPFVVASLAVALTMGFTVGATMLVWASVGSPDESWATHLQPHGVAQIFGWAGLFVMGVSMHVVPRFRGNAPVRFPRPQQAILALMLAGIVLRATGQAFYRHDAAAPLLVTSGLALFAGTMVFALTLAEVLRRGHRGPVRVEHWFWTGISWAVIAGGLHLWVVLDMAGGTRIAADPDLDGPFIWAGIAGFVLPFIFGVSRRAIAGFLGLQPSYSRLDALACVLVNAGVALMVVAHVLGAGATRTAPGTLALAAGALTFVVALRIFEPPLRAAAVSPGSYPRYGWFVRAAYGWLVVAMVLLGASALADLSLLPALRLQALAPLHTLAVGFITMTIVGFASRALPLFEQRRQVERTWLLDVAFVVLNLSVLARLLFGVNDMPSNSAGLAVSGVLGLAGIACFGGFASGVLRPARSTEAEQASLLPPNSAAPAAHRPRAARDLH